MLLQQAGEQRGEHDTSSEFLGTVKATAHYTVTKSRTIRFTMICK